MPLQIYCRIRDGSYDKIVQGNNMCKIKIKHNKKNHEFIINKLWGPDVANEKIFDDIFSNTSDYSTNYWVAFGYTGSGKTYTTSNLIRNLYNTLNVDKKCKICVTAIQIYNNNIYDLLNNNNQLVFYKTNELVIKNVTKRDEDINSIIDMCVQNRNTAQTEMNNVSSRSHAIITIHYNNKKYVIVDMAGQERVANTNNDLLIQKQANNINLNMLALKECIRSKNDNKKYIPYRQTLITLAIKPIFEDKCNVAFICNVNLKQSLYYQIDSLRYASSLYRKTSVKEDKFMNLFELYTSYIQNVEWYACQERLLWVELKEGKMKNFNNMNVFLKKKKKFIDDMIKSSKVYDKDK